MENNITYHASLLPGKTAVTLVAHGLNLKPEAMLPLITWLNGKGSDVYLVRLLGHRKDEMDIADVTSELWQTEMRVAYEVASQASLQYSVPLYFLGYSLGALLGQTFMPVVPFDRQVLIAPAIAIRRRAYLLKVLFPLGKRIKLPSFTPEGLKANHSLPLAVYSILFAEERKYRDAGVEKGTVPTMIIMDPRDELISYKKLMNHIQRFGLSNYRVIALENDVKSQSSKYRHLIIDAHTMGTKNWELCTGEMSSFLFSKRD